MAIRSRRQAVPYLPTAQPSTAQPSTAQPSTAQIPIATPSPLSRISEATIRDLATERSFDRGMDYYERGAIANPTQQDDRIWADCYGSDQYHTSARFTTSNEVVTADDIKMDCTCPYSFGGACKHEVALLLTYLYEPQTFHVIPPLRELLANHSRDDLFNLLEKLLHQSPELIQQLELVAEVSKPQSSGKSIDLTSYRSQVRRILKYDDVRAIVSLFEPIIQRAEQFEASGDCLNAGNLYAVLLSELTIVYPSELLANDHNYDLCGSAYTIVKALGVCLGDESITSSIRQDWLNILLEAALVDINLGGMGFAEGAERLVLELATEEEWTVLEARIRQELSRTSRSWGQNAIASFIAQRFESVGRSEAAEEVMLDLSSPEQQIFILVKQGKFDSAIDRAKTILPKFPGLIFSFADALVEAGEPKKALQYMTEMDNAPTITLHRSNEWFSKFHQGQGDFKTALKFEEASFLKYPSFGKYLEIKELTESIGNWSRVRSRLLKQLTDSQKWVILIEIAIDEKESQKAIKLLKDIPQHLQFDLKRKIAEISEPTVAIALYEEIVHELIARKHRSYYQEAVRYLRLIQKLKNLGSTAPEWQDYIQQLRVQYPTLKALHGELSKL